MDLNSNFWKYVQLPISDWLVNACVLICSSCTRLRICMLINWLLKHLGNSFEIDEAMYKKIYANMSERMKDKAAEIRAQAVTALHRLQVGEMQGNEL